MSENAEEHLPTSGVRPRFKIETSQTIGGISQKVDDFLKEEGSNCIGTVGHKFISLRIPISQQHYWSPQLSVTLEETDQGSIIRGVYGPRPAVWTMFIFFYTLIGLAILAISVIGLSKLSLDKSAQILWLLPMLFGVFTSLYLVASYGKKLGHDQMIILQSFFEDALK